MPAADERVLSLFGLAARGGAVIAGIARVREAVRAGGVALVVLAADASRNSRDKLVPLLDARGVAWMALSDRDALGRAVGKAPLSALGITDARLAARVRELTGS